MNTSSDASTIDEVVDFWLGQSAAGAPDKQQMARWFKADPALDSEIERRFGTTLMAARGGQRDHWTATPRGWLALLIVLDQFSRNIHRGTAQAFAADAQARAIALAGIERGDDQLVAPLARLFCYLPLEHAEDLSLQHRSVALFTALHADADDAQRALLATTLDYAHQHAQVIERFGRFPHRNRILGRVDTPEELLYLAQPGAGF
ncbi:MAG: DUF924 domain-containing protein [Xanthomonadales bacterium]|nr:DUF924 domain-containing protein [Xanthomonadales bacterium]